MRQPNLQHLRRQIDDVDRRILPLLNRRARLAMRVGALKRRQGLKLFDPARERTILRRLGRTNAGPLSSSAVQAIYREILRQARRLEQSV